MTTDLIVKIGIVMILQLQSGEPNATENPPPSPPVIDFLGRHKIRICLQTIQPYRRLVSPKTRHPSLTPKGETGTKVWSDFVQQSVKCFALLQQAKTHLLFLHVTLQRVGLLWWDQQLACLPLVTLLAHYASQHIRAVANQHSCGKTTASTRMPLN